MMNQWSTLLNQAQDPIYLIHGDEHVLIKEAILWLKEHALQGGIEDFNCDRFSVDDDHFSVAKIVNAARTFPMMGGRRVVWVKGCQRLNLLAKNELKPLLEYIQTPEAETCLILESLEPLNKTKSLYKALSSKKSPAHVQFLEKLKGNQLDQWIRKQAQTLKVKISPQASALIQETVGDQLGMLSDTLEKLSLYVSPRVHIEESDVQELLPQSRLQTTVWAFLDAVVARNAGKALMMLHALLEQGQAPLSLFALLTRQIRNLLLAYSIKAKGGSQKELASLAKIPPFAAKKLLQSLNQEKRFSARQLSLAYEVLLRADQKLKGSKVPPEVVLEGVLLEICLLDDTH